VNLLGRSAFIRAHYYRGTWPAVTKGYFGPPGDMSLSKFADTKGRFLGSVSRFDKISGGPRVNIASYR